MREDAALKKAKSGGRKCNTKSTGTTSDESVVTRPPSSSTPTSTTTTSLGDVQDSFDNFWECTFCYEEFCQDGKEWLQCACSRWVHEQCLEEIVLDDQGEERFCPFCINQFQV